MGGKRKDVARGLSEEMGTRGCALVGGEVLRKQQ